MNLTSTLLAAAAVFTLAGGAHAAVISTVFSADGRVPIYDAPTSAAISTLNFTGHGRVLDVNVLLDITHGWDADLVISLSHGGRTVLLSKNQGGAGGANYTNTVFDDQATVAINAGFAYAPFSGRFRPQAALSAFNGMDPFGLWTLSVLDVEAADEGTINYFGIAAAVPEPGTLALLSLGLAGFALARRKKS